MLSPYVQALVGGVLIGTGSLLAVAATGKIPGISGVFSRLLRRPNAESGWRALFLVGLIAGAAIGFTAIPAAAVYRPVASLVATGIAGVLVGFGTRLGGGCTSGHGVCGIGLGSKSSIIATLLFMAAGVATVFVVRHGLASFPR